MKVYWASLVAQTGKGLSAMQETQVQSLGWEDPLEKEMAVYSSILAWKIPWTGEPGGLQSMGSQRLGKEYNKGVYCHPVYLTYMQSTSYKTPYWMNHKLESRWLGEIPTTSDMQTISL